MRFFAAHPNISSIDILEPSKQAPLIKSAAFKCDDPVTPDVLPFPAGTFLVYMRRHTSSYPLGPRNFGI